MLEAPEPRKCRWRKILCTRRRFWPLVSHQKEHRVSPICACSFPFAALFLSVHFAFYSFVGAVWGHCWTCCGHASWALPTSRSACWGRRHFVGFLSAAAYGARRVLLGSVGHQPRPLLQALLQTGAIGLLIRDTIIDKEIEQIEKPQHNNAHRGTDAGRVRVLRCRCLHAS